MACRSDHPGALPGADLIRRCPERTERRAPDRRVSISYPPCFATKHRLRRVEAIDAIAVIYIRFDEAGPSGLPKASPKGEGSYPPEYGHEGAQLDPGPGQPSGSRQAVAARVRREQGRLRRRPTGPGAGRLPSTYEMIQTLKAKNLTSTDR